MGLQAAGGLREGHWLGFPHLGRELQLREHLQKAAQRAAQQRQVAIQNVLQARGHEQAKLGAALGYLESCEAECATAAGRLSRNGDGVAELESRRGDLVRTWDGARRGAQAERREQAARLAAAKSRYQLALEHAATVLDTLDVLVDRN